MNFGFQSNSRRENEGGNQISLNMHLITALYQLMWIKPLKADKLQLIISHGSTYENNTNYGGRIIIPDAHMFESSVAAFLKSTSGILTVEVGAGGNVKMIKTLETRQLNAPGANILPFTRTKPSFNGMLGIALNPNIHWNIKLNVASGFRAPNLAELSSNGVHEGIYRYEIGDPKMKNEQNLNEDLGITYQSKWFRAQASGFYMRFFNYVYIAPSANETFYGFPVFRFKQQNAAIYGSEAAFSLTPQGALKGLSWNNTFAYVLGKTDDANYLPYMPATWIDSRLDYQRITGKKVDVNLGAGFRYVFAQNHPFVNETKTPAYYLMDAHVGIDVRSKIGPVHIAIVGNNLLDAKYFDHLSRFKNYGIYNIGRDISLNFQFPITFINHSKTNKQ
jgi:iron complex outermembrane receptor protein